MTLPERLRALAAWFATSPPDRVAIIGAQATLREAADMIDSLWYTEDGVLMTPGMVVWRVLLFGSIEEYTLDSWQDVFWVAGMGRNYSTQEAADAARKKP